MADAIFEARMRSYRLSYRDGLSEIMPGVIVLQGFCGNLIIHSGYVPGIIIYMVLLLAFSIYARRMLDAVRARIAYLRSGYVQAFTRKGWSLIGMVMALLGTCALVIVLRAGRAGSADAAGWVQWVPAFAGLGFGAIEIYIAIRYEVPRAFLVAIFSMILGVVVSLELPFKPALTIFLAGFGFANLSSGGVALLSYLKTPQRPANET
jgi:hypothetical protein